VGSENETAGPITISYGSTIGALISLPDCGLLWERDIHKIDPVAGVWKDIPTIFSESGRHTLPFDLFAGIFFLISRYEEYSASYTDKHGRYPPELSTAFRSGFLDRPVVDEWIFQFYKLLKQAGCKVSLPSFSFQPSYDIDIAFSYLHKGFIRSAGALAKDLSKGKISEVGERLQVLRGRQNDPYDCFEWLADQHRDCGLSPVYFILAALQPTRFDKNNSTTHPAMIRTIKSLAQEGKVGMHPSYFSNDATIFSEERKLLEKHCGRKITLSRQHYIRLSLPTTYYHLLKLGITDDWSMGYGSSLGFRAGTGRSFFWYDLTNEQQTSLRVHPFCFMDSTAHFEEKLGVLESFEKLQSMSATLQQTQSTLVTVFHNFSLGSERQWIGWREAYGNFLQHISKM